MSLRAAGSFRSHLCLDLLDAAVKDVKERSARSRSSQCILPLCAFCRGCIATVVCDDASFDRSYVHCVAITAIRQHVTSYVDINQVSSASKYTALFKTCLH